MMKRNIISLGVISALIITLAACTKEAAPVQPEGLVAVPFEFSAAITKTANAGEGTIWTAGDAVNLFHSLAGAGDYAANGQFTISPEDLEAKKFKGTLSAALENGKSYDWVAFYPYSSTNTSPSAVKVNLGTAVQNGDDDMTHVAGENFPLWGVATGVEGELTMQMKHLSSLLEVEVLNSTAEQITVSSVAFTAKEEIAGEFTVDLTSETPVFVAVSGQTSETSSLTVNDAQNIEKGTSAKYYLAVKPFTAPAGSTLVLSVNGIDYELNLKSDVVFAPGAIKPLKFDYDKTAAPTVTIKNVAFSSADLEWTTDGLAKSFNIYVNGEKVVSDIASDATAYHLTGLVSGVESVIEVEAVGDHNTAKSAQQTVKTSGVRMLGNSRHHITIEWDEVGKVYNGTAGGGNNIELERGYYIGVYADAECTQKIFEFCPYDAMTSRYYGYATSSTLGKVGGKSFFINTRLAIGSLDEDTDYYVRVRTLNGFEFSYSGTAYTVAHPYGNTEWSSPLAVSTMPAHQPADNEVIFADFDEFSVCPDRYFGAPGTVPASFQIGDREDMRAISIGYTVSKNIDAYGIAQIGTTTDDADHRDYFNGKYFNIDYSGTTKYDNYIVKEGYELAGWHMSNNVRPAMGTLLIDKARNRMIGTPALTKNLSSEPRPCILTFDQCVFLPHAPKEDAVKIYIYRDGELLAPVYTYTVKTDSYDHWTDSNNYKVDYKYTTKSFTLDLKAGDAVLIGTGNEDLNNNIVIDNFKITVCPEGSGSLEIPEWGSDNDGLEI